MIFCNYFLFATKWNFIDKNILGKDERLHARTLFILFAIKKGKWKDLYFFFFCDAKKNTFIYYYYFLSKGKTKKKEILRKQILSF